MGRTQQEPGGDYGYDLVHQDVPEGSARPTPDRPDAVPAAPSGQDSSGDYAYDEAHDF
jgi:hypothetical protein